MSLLEQFIEELKQFDPYVAERVFPHKGNPPPAIEYRCQHFTVALLLKELDRQDERCKALERKLTAMAELVYGGV